MSAYAAYAVQCTHAWVWQVALTSQQLSSAVMSRLMSVACKVVLTRAGATSYCGVCGLLAVLLGKQGYNHVLTQTVGQVASTCMLHRVQDSTQLSPSPYGLHNKQVRPGRRVACAASSCSHRAGGSLSYCGAAGATALTGSLFFMAWGTLPVF